MLFKNREQIINNGQTLELKKTRKDILDFINSALDAVDSYNSVKSKFEGKKIIFKKETFDISDFENVYLIGFGKASVGMSQAVCDSIEVKSGAIITNDPENKVRCRSVKTLLGNHPIPSQKNIDNTEIILDIVKKCEENDFLIILISGGGSSLLCKPRVSLNDLQQTTDLLLKSGANIKEINTIRKHISFVKGGQFTALVKCTTLSFIISDIIGDPIEFIASGPTYPDSTTFIDAKKILKKYDLLLKIPFSVKKIINDGIQGIISETPKKNNPVFKNVFNCIVSNNEIACNAVKERAKELGYKTMLLTTSLDGEAKDIGKHLVDKAINYITEKKMLFITAGETTVTIKGSGKGGRNQEMVLGSVKELADKDVVFSSFATDGIDGMCDAAGAIADAYTLKRANKKNLDQQIFLEKNNSYEFFKILGDLIITGPTGINVMDIQILIKLGKKYKP